jgi:uncharacterized protein with ParB-like and HNH nuclease domain
MLQLNVTQKVLRDFLAEFGKSSNQKRIIIPDYQREYEWDNDNCLTLWSDILNAFERGVENYFLGVIVTYINAGNSEIIDGQQRITTYILLLRAIYNNLSQNKTAVAGALNREIKPCIWFLDNFAVGILDENKHIIETKIATDQFKKYFEEILTSGKSSNMRKKDMDRYTDNFSFFEKQIGNFVATNAISFEDFINYILKRVVILPIECNAKDTALSIFQTLNDRGLPLNDVDIFKATIYKNKTTDEEKNNFIMEWKDILNNCKKINLNLDFIFRNYMFILRAEDGDKSIESAIREYFNGKLKDKDLLKKINSLIDIFNMKEICIAYDKTKINKDNEFYSKIEKDRNIKIQQYLHILKYYTNYYSDYVVTVFCYYKYNEINFVESFELFLSKLIAFLFYCFIYTKASNTIKVSIYEIMAEIVEKKDINTIFKDVFDKVKLDIKNLRENIDNSYNNKITRGLLLLNSYLQQGEKLIDDDFEIEHIFPRSWKKAYNYKQLGYTDDIVNEFLEKLGNKTIIESKINRKIKNYSFDSKKEEYKESKINEIRKIEENSKWYKKEVEKRNEEIIDRLYNFFEEKLSK